MKQVGLAGSLSSGWGTAGVVLENQTATRVVFSPPSMPCFTHSSRVESRLPTALLLVPLAFQPAKGSLLPCVRSQGWNTQYVAQSTPQGRFLHVYSFFFPLSPLPGAQIPH